MAGKELRQQRWIGVGTPRAAGAPAAGRNANGSETVLVVDDEPAVRKLIEQILVSEGYHVRTASSGERALEQLARREDIDAILTDVVMPRMSGPELVRRARLVRDDFRVLYMSGYDRDGALAEADVAADDFLAKPFSSAELIRKLRAVLDR